MTRVTLNISFVPVYHAADGLLFLAREESADECPSLSRSNETTTTGHRFIHSPRLFIKPPSHALG